MVIVIGHLPPGVDVDEVERALRLRKARTRIFRKSGRRGEALRYALIQVEDGTGRALLRRRHLCNGRPLSPHLYQTRRIANERRAIGWRTRDWTGVERREGERRSPDIGIEPVLNLTAGAGVPAG